MNANIAEMSTGNVSLAFSFLLSLPLPLSTLDWPGFQAERGQVTVLAKYNLAQDQPAKAGYPLPTPNSWQQVSAAQ